LLIRIILSAKMKCVFFLSKCEAFNVEVNETNPFSNENNNTRIEKNIFRIVKVVRPSMLWSPLFLKEP